jgi:hypothetical protein
MTSHRVVVNGMVYEVEGRDRRQIVTDRGASAKFESKNRSASDGHRR